ncbi:LysM peptidoglycan-binding domain-containing protein [Demequina soli]|uniref:LysM peptidoglycan-binding domain-containing protein n=1 Tax=Demequina soli TaxID=1638987 RepID=UPI000783D8D7|nr:LysM domain-containing protein [Demequina soli]
MVQTGIGAGTSGRGAGTMRGAGLVAALAAGPLGTAAGLMAWRAAAQVDWRLWTAADAVVVAAGIVGAAVAARFLAEVVAALVARARGVAAPAWTGRLARSAAATLAAVALSAGAAQAADPPPSAGWLPDGAGAGAPWAPATQAPLPARVTATATATATVATPAATDGAADAPAARTPAAPAAPAAPPRASTDAATVHVVVAGECLWTIAAGMLGPDAGDAAVADAWPALYAANRDRIGPDPDLILPGLALEVPAALDGGAR